MPRKPKKSKSKRPGRLTKPKKDKKPKKKDDPLVAVVDLSLKLVTDFTTRRQTSLSQIENWTSGIESWTLGKVTERAATSPVTATIVETAYDLEITDYGRIEGTDERAWQLYPSRVTRLTVADGDEAAARTHFDGYLDDLRAEIETFIESNRVTHRATVTHWHIHYSTGSLDEVV